MPTQIYKLKDGTRTVGTTTVIGAVKLGGIEQLLHWANKEGLAGRDYKESRQKAADAGTCAHDRAYCHAHNQECDQSKYPPEVWEASKAPFEAFLRWADQSKLQIIAGELPLVSEKYRYGGC